MLADLARQQRYGLGQVCQRQDRSVWITQRSQAVEDRTDERGNDDDPARNTTALAIHDPQQKATNHEPETGSLSVGVAEIRREHLD